MCGPAIRSGGTVIDGARGEDVPERYASCLVLADQATENRLAQCGVDLVRSQTTDMGQDRLRLGVHEHRGGQQHLLCLGAEPADAVGDRVPDRRRHVDLVEGAPDPLAVPPDQVGAGMQKPYRLFKRQRHAFGSRVQQLGEGRGDQLVVQHRGDQLLVPDSGRARGRGSTPLRSAVPPDLSVAAAEVDVACVTIVADGIAPTCFLSAGWLPYQKVATSQRLVRRSA